MEIMPNVHLIPDVIAHPYLIIGSDGLTLIDCGLPGSDKKILRYIGERGFRAQDLARIVLTHSDMDHVGSLAALKRASGARLYASAIEASAIAQGVPSRRVRSPSFGRRLFTAAVHRFLKVIPVQIDELVTEGQSLPALGGLEVLATPGHTPGHISLFSPSTGILFAGDSIVSREAGLLGSVPPNTWDADQAVASIRKQLALRASVVCTGHGPVVKGALAKLSVA